MPRMRTILSRSAIALFLALPLTVSAQETTTGGTEVSMSGGIKTDTSLPVNVESDSLSVDQETGIAVFTGNVHVTQGEVTITAPKATMYYTDDRSEIDRVHMEGGVLMTNKLEAVKGQDAVYTVTTGIVVVTGDVIVTQGKSTIAGPKLTYNLDTGAGQMEGGRVQSVFVPGKNKGAKDAGSGAAGSDSAQ